ncbi:MAG: 23S rRNA (adenine(2503)-C(2))-methyltransferase RlmN [Bacteroidetes bacterium SW_11_45_7]|nr:MAG: 23S rRNA (adenine(2503)-C(2))-methyltransferase RlmN [Bacteroidetes bacterium SW_11_45_7]
MGITETQTDIRKLSLDQLQAEIEQLGERPFRAQQIYEWLWEKSCTSFDEMTNLSKSLRDTLKDYYTIKPVVIDDKQQSQDGTIKFKFKLHDGHNVEGVLIPTEERWTACISSQIGCSLSCNFCATGLLDLKRNLTCAEIYDQVVLISNESLAQYNHPLTNIVYMGMGEPLLNYKNVLASVDRLTAENGLNMSPKRITVSTVGIAKMIRQLGDDNVRFNLALSLHAPTNDKRSEIMAINNTNDIDTLVDALNYFYRCTGNKLTFEYILFDRYNDTMDDARDLVKLCQRVPALVNVIEYNNVDGLPFSKAETEQREQFIGYLEDHDIVAKVRRSRGKDIDAACGQLANK